MTVGRQISECLIEHLGMNQDQARARSIELLEHVGIPGARKRYRNYPHQFSGGMRQRVMIAVAIACNPQIVIADEPTTALDVTVQAQIVELVQEDVRERLLALSTHKRPRRIQVRFEEFEKTTTQKIKRYLYAIDTAGR